MDCDIDIDLVHFEAQVWSLRRDLVVQKVVYKIAGLLGEPQAILFPRLCGTLEILLRLRVIQVF